jgi:hypothetical protein
MGQRHNEVSHVLFTSLATDVVSFSVFYSTIGSSSLSQVYSESSMLLNPREIPDELWDFQQVAG